MVCWRETHLIIWRWLCQLAASWEFSVVLLARPRWIICFCFSNFLTLLQRSWLWETQHESFVIRYTYCYFCCVYKLLPVWCILSLCNFLSSFLWKWAVRDNMTRSRMHADFLFPLQWAWLSEYEYFIGYNQWIWRVARHLCRIESQVAIWGGYLRLPNSCLKSNSPSRENDYKSSWRGHKHLDLMTLTQLLLGIKEVGFILRGPWMSVSRFNDNLSNSCREILYMYCKWWTKQPTDPTLPSV